MASAGCAKARGHRRWGESCRRSPRPVGRQHCVTWRQSSQSVTALNLPDGGLRHHRGRAPDERRRVHIEAAAADQQQQHDHRSGRRRFGIGGGRKCRRHSKRGTDRAAISNAVRGASGRCTARDPSANPHRGRTAPTGSRFEQRGQGLGRTSSPLIACRRPRRGSRLSVTRRPSAIITSSARPTLLLRHGAIAQMT